MAVVLIAVGVFLFLENLGILPIRNVWVFWPVFPIAFGLSRVFNVATASAPTSAILAICFGAFFLLSNLGWVQVTPHRAAWPFGLLIIAFGASILMKSPGPDSSAQLPAPEPSLPFEPSHPPRADYLNTLDHVAVLGSVKRRVESQSFSGGKLFSVLGSIEIDLRRAEIPAGLNYAVLNTTAVFAGIKLRIPQTWRIHITGSSILGSFEDNTLPPQTGPAAATLVITGLSLFGSVEIED